MLPKINLVVVGHKDHGKSTLIGRLLYDSKAFPEQKLQEIRAELEKSGKNTFEFDKSPQAGYHGLTIHAAQRSPQSTLRGERGKTGSVRRCPATVVSASSM